MIKSFFLSFKSEGNFHLFLIHHMKSEIFFAFSALILMITDYWVNAAWHGSNQPVALMWCSESPLIAPFSSSVLLGAVSHLPLDNTL